MPRLRNTTIAFVIGVAIPLLSFGVACSRAQADSPVLPKTIADAMKIPESSTIEKSNADWKAILSPFAYSVLREHATERPFTGEYADNKKEGLYICAACGNPLFSSKTKYNSGTGWPSFYEPVSANRVGTTKDTTYGMIRTEVHCKRCKGHLGHIFDDGPQPTGLRYCINSASLKFLKAQ